MKNSNTGIIITAVAIISLLIGAFVAPSLFGNKSLFDTVYKFDTAIISLPNGEIIQGEITSWTDYDDGDQLQVTLKNGTTYLCHSSNITLIDNKD
ncbi:hypothetical protein J6A31_05935 [bacterium]|nr:hypothetical protein [bacterium]